MLFSLDLSALKGIRKGKEHGRLPQLAAQGQSFNSKQHARLSAAGSETDPPGIGDIHWAGHVLLLTHTANFESLDYCSLLAPLNPRCLLRLAGVLQVPRQMLFTAPANCERLARDAGIDLVPPVVHEPQKNSFQPFLSLRFFYKLESIHFFECAALQPMRNFARYAWRHCIFIPSFSFWSGDLQHPA